ncbi:MAG: amino acid ABC transporter permease [Clostridiales bacterium]|nr:amino acid ABC transporter permease [Clostridiales bacterium]MDY4173616.1 amino acid ABC transporter permease [Evtepia sp.]
MDKIALLGFDIARLWAKYWPNYLVGIRNTLIVAVIATLVGCIIGLICGILNTIPYTKNDSLGKRFILKLIRVIIRIYVEVFRGTPMILQAVFIYYGLPYFTDGSISFKGNAGIWVASLIVVSINTGAYMAESVRGGIISVDPGQTEGAKAIGMTHVQTMYNVILPQAFRNIIPQIGNNFIINIKDTSVMFVIGFIEFFATHRNIVGVNLMYFPSAVIEMAGYLCLTLTASILLRLLEKKMDGNDNYDLVQVDALTMSAGTYNHPGKGTPFDERNPEAQKSMFREELRRQAERDAALREGQMAETRRSHGNDTMSSDGGDR